MPSIESKTIISSNFELPSKSNISISEHGKLNFTTKSGRNNISVLIHNRKNYKAILHANPSTVDLFFLALIKSIFFTRTPIFLFDLILKNPKGVMQKLIAALKGFFLKQIDFIFVIHRDTTGYQNAYGLKTKQFIYVPFKANNFDIKESFEIKDEGYIVSLGASQRDYATLIAAAKGLNYKVVIICSDKSAIEHNANIGVDADYPENLVRIKQPLDRDHLYNMIAKSTFVAIPILESSIQPAGVSVYLESMIFKKAVVITEGASTIGILNPGKDALVVPAADADALREAMQNLISNAELRADIASAGYEYAYSLLNDARLRENLLSEIIAKISLH